MKFIRIAYLSGGQKFYTSFSFDGFSEIKSEDDAVYLYFNSLSSTGPFSSGKIYYGTGVEFIKTGFGYQIFQEITLSLSYLSQSRIAYLDFTSDPLVTITFSSISN